MNAESLIMSRLHGDLLKAGMKAYNTLIHGEDDGEDDTAEEVVAEILEARLFLENTKDAKLQLLLDALDEMPEYGRIGSCLVFIPNERYEEITKKFEIDETKWWGFRKLADRVLPEKDLDSALNQLSKEGL